MTRVLIVEDEPDLADPLAYLLRREGFDVEIAEDGPSAVDAYTARGADIVLLDLMLPGMSGTEVCRRLRAQPGPAAQLPVIFLTARNDEVDRVLGLELGADDYMTKPFSPRELVARIKAVLRRRAPQVTDDAVELGGLRLDPATHRVSAGDTALALLKLMADQGKDWPLIEGTGAIYGFYAIESLDTTRSEFFSDGKARRIDFTLTLKRIDDSMLDSLGAVTRRMLDMFRK